MANVKNTNNIEDEEIILTDANDNIAQSTYSRTYWHNDITPLNAENMNRIEEGIVTRALDIAANRMDIIANRKVLQKHIDNKENPHEVKASQVDYTAKNNSGDGNKVQTALDKHRTELDNHDSRITTNKNNIETEIGNRISEDSRILGESKNYTNDEITGLELSIEKKSNVDYIVIKNKSGTEVASVNASTFVKDGMIDSASYNTTTNKLTLTWNTDSGKTSITELDLNDLVDIYTGGTGINISTNGTVSIDTKVVATKTDIDSMDSELRELIQNIGSGGTDNTSVITPITESQINIWDLGSGIYRNDTSDTLYLFLSKDENGTTYNSVDLCSQSLFYIHCLDDCEWSFMIPSGYINAISNGNNLPLNTIIWGKTLLGLVAGKETYSCQMNTPLQSNDIINVFNNEFTSNIITNNGMLNIAYQSTALKNEIDNLNLSGNYVRICFVPSSTNFNTGNTILDMVLRSLYFNTARRGSQYVYGMCYWVDIPVQEYTSNWNYETSGTHIYPTDHTNQRHTVTLKYNITYNYGKLTCEAYTKEGYSYQSGEYEPLSIFMVYDGGGCDKIANTKVSGPVDVFVGSWVNYTPETLYNGAAYFDKFKIDISTNKGRGTILAGQYYDSDSSLTFLDNYNGSSVYSSGNTMSLTPSFIRNDTGKNQNFYLCVGVSDTPDGEISAKLLVQAQYQDVTGNTLFESNNWVVGDINSDTPYSITGTLDLSSQDTETKVNLNKVVCVDNDNNETNAYIRYVHSADNYIISGSGFVSDALNNITPLNIKLISYDGEHYILEYITDEVGTYSINKIRGYN